MQEVIVKGPPGTGKTSFAKRTVESLAKKHSPSKMALVSFTNTAAATLASRGIPVPKTNIGTLHSFAFRAIGATTEQVAETKIDDFNSNNPNYAISGEYTRYASPEHDQPGDGVPTATAGDELFSKYQILRAKMAPRETWPNQVRVFADKWESWKNANDLIDFTDMIEIATDVSDEMPTKPEYIIADEAQDFSRQELTLLKKWSQSTRMIMWLGDSDQTLYEFKGVSATEFIRPDLPDMNKRVLSRSYRVPREVHKLALNWINRATDRETVEYLPTEVDGSVSRSRATFKSPERILNILEKADAADQTVMIMASCSYMLEPVIQILRKAGVPFHNPNRTSRGDWNPLNASGTTAAMRLLAFLRPDNATWRDDARFWSGEDLRRWSEVLAADGILKRGAKTALEKLEPERELTVADLFYWFELDAIEKAIDLDVNWYRSSLLKSRAKSFEFPFAVMEKRGAATLRETPRVKVGTIHSFKGDEADQVVLFPDLSIRGARQWESSAERNSIYRQFYVAMTRSKNRLVVCDPATNLAVKLV